MGSGKLSLRSPPLSPNTQHTQRDSLELRPIGAAAGLPGAPPHKAPPAHTRRGRSRRARPHNRTARSPPRPLAGVPASPAPGPPSLHTRPGRRSPGAGRGRRRSPAAAPRAPRQVRPPPPRLTRGAAQQQAQRPQQPHGAAAAPAARRVAAPAASELTPPLGAPAPPPAVPPPPAPPARPCPAGPALPGSAKFCKRPSSRRRPATRPGVPTRRGRRGSRPFGLPPPTPSGGEDLLPARALPSLSSLSSAPCFSILRGCGAHPLPDPNLSS